MNLADDTHCWYCGAKSFVYDHAVPTSRGGGNARWNKIPACKTCNFRKSSKMVEEFRQYIAKKTQTSAYLFWIEREIGKTITDILIETQIKELEEYVENEKRLIKDYRARASQKETRLVDLEKKLRTLKASLDKNGLVPSCL